MTKETIGHISGIIVILSAFPYIFRVWQGKITTKVTSWALWALIGSALLLTYRSSGAESNIWPAVFGFTNPCIITVISIMKQGERSRPSKTDWLCIIIALTALVGWWFVRDNKSLSCYALCLSILADICAAVPTVIFLWNQPWEDRPFAWGAFAVAYSMAFFAAPEPSFANYILPTWMVLGSGSLTIMLVRYRIRVKSPLREWI